MSKKQSSLAVLLFATGWVIAQSCCALSASIGADVLPAWNKQIAGVRYSYKIFSSESFFVQPGPDPVSSEAKRYQLHTAEAFARIALGKRHLLHITVPALVLRGDKVLPRDNGTRSQGIGDPSLLYQYQILLPKHCSDKKWQHWLRAGMGLKFPVGKFDIKNHAVLQFGNGSLGLLWNTAYTLRTKKMGFNLVANYLLQTMNSNAVKLGDVLSLNAGWFYDWHIKQSHILPTLGVSYNKQMMTYSINRWRSYTGSDQLVASLGVDFFWKRLAVSVSTQPTIYAIGNHSTVPLQRFNLETGLYYIF